MISNEKVDSDDSCWEEDFDGNVFVDVINVNWKSFNFL